MTLHEPLVSGDEASSSYFGSQLASSPLELAA